MDPGGDFRNRVPSSDNKTVSIQELIRSINSPDIVLSSRTDGYIGNAFDGLYWGVLRSEFYKFLKLNCESDMKHINNAIKIYNLFIKDI